MNQLRFSAAGLANDGDESCMRELVDQFADAVLLPEEALRFIFPEGP